MRRASLRQVLSPVSRSVRTIPPRDTAMANYVIREHDTAECVGFGDTTVAWRTTIQPGCRNICPWVHMLLKLILL